MRITVTAPTGNIGRALTERLLEAGTEVTLLARSPEKVGDFVERGARVVEGSLENLAAVQEATEAADALFWLTPGEFRGRGLSSLSERSGRGCRPGGAFPTRDARCEPVEPRSAPQRGYRTDQGPARRGTEAERGYTPRDASAADLFHGKRPRQSRVDRRTWLDILDRPGGGVDEPDRHGRYRCDSRGDAASVRRRMRRA